MKNESAWLRIEMTPSVVAERAITASSVKVCGPAPSGSLEFGLEPGSLLIRAMYRELAVLEHQGDGMKLPRFYVFSLVAMLSLFRSVNADIRFISSAEIVGDVVGLVYDPGSGNLSLDTGGKVVSTLEIKSATGVFTGTQPALVLPPFDVFTREKFFILKTNGIGDSDFGPAMGAGFALDFLAGDLTVSGSLLPSGSLDAGLVAPEPTTGLGTGLAMIVVCHRLRRRSTSDCGS